MKTLAQVKEEEIEARLSAKVAKVVWQELVREWEILHRCRVQLEGKVLVCVLLLVFIGGCQAFAGASRDAEWSFRKLGDMAEKAKLEDR